MLRFLPYALAALLACACTSGSDSKSSDRDTDKPEFVGPPTRVSWKLFKSGQEITLVNESHTDKVDLYSEVRDAAGPKVTTDDVMDGLLDYFEDQHYERYSRPGPAPEGAVGRVSQTLQVEVAGQVSHMLWSVDHPQEERDAFNECVQALAGVWNLTYAPQAVRNEKGKAIFGNSSAGDGNR